MKGPENNPNPMEAYNKPKKPSLLSMETKEVVVMKELRTRASEAPVRNLERVSMCIELNSIIVTPETDAPNRPRKTTRFLPKLLIRSPDKALKIVNARPQIPTTNETSSLDEDIE